MDFTDRMAGAQARIYAELGRAGFVHPSDGSAPVPVQAIVRTPTREEQLQAVSVQFQGPYARIPHSQIARLRKGDVIVRSATDARPADAWRIDSPAERPSPGHVWIAPVSPAALPDGYE